jgi:hypothetical protein
MSDDTRLPVEEVLAVAQRSRPSIRVERHRGTHPADDDNLWFLSEGLTRGVAEVGTIVVQIGTHPGGQPPFLIESTGHDHRVTTSDVDEAVTVILSWLADH